MKKNNAVQREELLNTISHAIGAIFGIFGLFLLLDKNIGKTPYATFSIAVYSLTFIAMFLASCLYHYFKKPELKRKLRIADHISIYFLIAGTYTPVCLIALIQGVGWNIFYIIWGIAFLGTSLKLFFTGKFEIVSLALYLGMGWLVIYYFDIVVESVSGEGIRLLFLGGAFYTIGAIFYAVRRIPYNHFIWHLFVLGGAFSHWLMMYYYVV